MQIARHPCLVAILSLALPLAAPARAVAQPAAPPPATSRPAEPCPAADVAPGDAAAPVGHLDRVAAALKPGGVLNILAIGSGTLTGPDLESPTDSFPYRMVEALRRAAPDTEINLTVRGRRGMPATDMIALMRVALAGRPYRLVLWQTGTVEAVLTTPPDSFARTLQEGTALVAEKNADLILVDAQFSRMLTRRVNLLPYEDALQAAARQPDTVMFPRYALMRGWAEGGGIDLERAPPMQRNAIAARLHACLGESLARLVLDAAK
jgi:hypothetical protein